MAKRKKKEGNSSTFWLVGGGIAGVVLFVVLVGCGGVLMLKARARLVPNEEPDTPVAVEGLPKEKKPADLEKIDPHWRHEAIVARWQATKIEDNGADTVLAISQLLPKDIGPRIKGYTEIKRVGPNLSYPERAKWLRPLVPADHPAVAKARMLAKLPAGRFNLVIPKNPFKTVVNGPEALRTVHFLNAISVLDLVDDRPDDALLAIQGMVNVAHYLKEEPILASQIVRTGILQIAVNRLEETLRHKCKNEAKESTLAGLQELLWNEGADTEILWTVRCERAFGNLVFERLQKKEITLSDLNGVGGLPNDLSNRMSAGSIESAHKYYLRKTGEAEVVAAKPAPDQLKKLESVDLSVNRQGGDLGALLFPPVRNLLRPYWVRCTSLRAAAAGLAAERYRRANNKTPTDLSDLIPKYLPSQPIDPYSVNPLFYARLGAGVAIYTLAEPGVQTPRTMEDMATADFGVVSFRVWNPAERPALP